MSQPSDHVDVIAPNFKKRISGVTSTIFRLVPLQAKEISIVACGPEIPREIPQIKPVDLLRMSAAGPNGVRVWHARRNLEMLAGLVLKNLLGKNLALLFTSASQRRHSRYTKWLVSKMDEVIATSAKTAAYLDRPSIVIHHGIDAETFTLPESKSALRRELRLPETGFLIGCYGRVRAQKGVDVFVDAMIATLPDNPDAYGIIMGGITKQHEGFAEEMKARIKAAGLSQRILFFPEVAPLEMPKWYQALDLYVAPQRSEGFGLTPLEAMACGVPVVATRVGAFEELVSEQNTGTLLWQNDIPLMIETLSRVLADRPLIAEWAEKARPHVLTHFRIEDEAAAINEIYRRLLGLIPEDAPQQDLHTSYTRSG